MTLVAKTSLVINVPFANTHISGALMSMEPYLRDSLQTCLAAHPFHHETIEQGPALRLRLNEQIENSLSNLVCVYSVILSKICLMRVDDYRVSIPTRSRRVGSGGWEWLETRHWPDTRPAPEPAAAPPRGYRAG